MIVHIAIGNSDDKLTQRQWAKFYEFTNIDIHRHADCVIGVWVSPATAQWQNAAWCIDINDPELIAALRKSLSELARLFVQDSIAWTPGVTEFIEPRPDDNPSEGEQT